MMLGKIDVLSLTHQSNGKIRNQYDLTPQDLLEKNPALKEVTDDRLGRLSKMLLQVKEKIDSDGGDGPWVLQWQKGTLVLGKYEIADDPAAEAEEEMETEEIMTA